MEKSENEKMEKNIKAVMGKPKDYLESWVRSSLHKRLQLESKDKEIERLDKIANQRTATPSEYEREKHRLTKAAFDGVGEKVEELREEIAELKEDLDKQYDILIGWEKDYKKEKARSQGLLEASKKLHHCCYGGDHHETYVRLSRAIKKYEEGL